MLKEFGPNRNIFKPDTPFLRDHVWSHGELFSKTLT